MSRRIRPGLVIAAVVLVCSGLLWPLISTDAAPAGTVRLLDSANTPIADSDVRVLCYRTPGASAPFLDIVLHTDSSGELVGGLPAGCDYLAALHEIHEQPSSSSEHGPAYWVYATSWSPGSTDPKAAMGDIYIRDEWSLVLFNVVASLGWEPAPGSAVTTELHEGLRSASDYLYDLTEGQMAFGPIEIHTGGRRWSSADMRFLPANDYRPSAYVGGVVSESVAYTATATLSETVFVPGSVFLGRYWDGEDAFNPVSGTWSTPAANRTLVHEWAHHALFLYDEYQTTAGSRTYCTCDLPDPSLSDCSSSNPDLAASAMAFHYVAGELWYPPEHGEPAVCTTTRQWQVHGMDDWKTLTYWDDIQSLPAQVDMLLAPSGLEAAGPPTGLAGDLFGRSAGFRTHMPVVMGGGTPTMTVTQPQVNVLLPAGAGLRLTDTPPTQIYTLDEITDGAPDRILHQGTAIGPPKPAARQSGQIELLDITNGDGVRVFVDRYRTPGRSGERFVFPGSPTDAGFLTSDPFDAETQSSSPMSLDASFALTGDRFDTLTMTLIAPALNVAPEAQLCDMDADTGCHPDWQETMTQVGPAQWAAVFSPLAGADELPLYGTVRVTTTEGELIRWYQMLGGVGPAHKDGHAPLRDGPVMVDTNEAVPEPGRCNRVLVMPAAEYGALRISLPTDQQGVQIQGVVGLPLDIDVLLADNGRCAGLHTGDHTLPVDIIVTLFYGQQQLDDAGIHESNLRLLHFNRVAGQSFWSSVGAFGQSTELNWLATGPVSVDGIYAIGYVSGN